MIGSAPPIVIVRREITLLERAIRAIRSFMNGGLWRGWSRESYVPMDVLTYIGTSSTTTDMWDAPDGIRALCIEIQAAGGGGGGVAATGGATVASAGSGAGGSYLRKLLVGDEIPARLYITLGALGAGGTAGANNGTGASSTSVISQDGRLALTCAGGAGGAGSTAQGTGNSWFAGAQINSSPSGGDVGIAGGPGKYGLTFGQAINILSEGGYSHLGVPSAGRANGTIVSGSGYGYGGTGNASLQNQVARAGGDGGPAIVILTPYF